MSFLFNKKLSFTLAGALTVVGGFKLTNSLGSSSIFQLQRVQAAAGKLEPRTVVLSVETSDDRGNRLKSIYTEALKADGSYALVYDSINMDTGQLVSRQRKLTGSNRLKTEILDNIQAKSTYRIKDDDFALYHLGAMRSPSGNCLKLVDGTDMATAANEVFERRESIHGVDAIRVVRQNPETISWYSPRHGCALVAEEVSYRVSDSNLPGRWLQGKSIKRLISLSDQEPSNEYFSIPDFYSELQPSLLFAKGTQALTGKEGICNAKAVEAQDKKYFAQRP